VAPAILLLVAAGIVGWLVVRNRRRHAVV